jgi:hypothetical protein
MFNITYSDKTWLIDGIKTSSGEKRLLFAKDQLVLNAWFIIDNIVGLVTFILFPSI